ncbi:RCC1/BLIP-II protein [Schizopora paradoxa]|uniref:RCC1/BLIP-II protein n=1 Tax=Schizopora paradoxa TaxID=27342 RepID=A0A0H2SCJ3_9AGAM|nr:RCC1/BLIP-II protein [Schizopora paradoxa]
MLHCARRKCASFKYRPQSAISGCTRHLSGGASSSSSSTGGRQRRVFHTGLVIAAGATVVALTSSRTKPVLNDAASPVLAKETKRVELKTALLKISPSTEEEEHLTTLVFGSNREGLLSPEQPFDQTFRTPTSVKWLHDTPLRDLTLHETFAACVDVKGDVYMWGEAAKDGGESHVRPTLILKGRDIVSLKASDSRILALSSSGKIFSLRAFGGRRSSEATEAPPSAWNPLNWVLGTSPLFNDDAVELLPAERLRRGEKFVAISSGAHHALALTSDGRTYAHPLSAQANDYGQLGQQRISLHFSAGRDSVSQNSTDLIPKALKDPLGRSTAYSRSQPNGEQYILDNSSSGSSPENSPYCAELYEVPSLRGIQVAQAIAGAKTSFVRTAGEGRVLAWGANQFGQLGLGSTVTADAILVPTEVVFSRSAPRGARSQCVDITTGGDVTFFTVERQVDRSVPSTDILACGMGQWGTLGNGLYSSAQGDPIRIRAVSGLMEYSDKTNSLQPIVPHALSASEAPMGHVLLTLDTLERAGNEFGGRDLLVWGNGREYQLGNGRRSSLASPSALEANDVKTGVSDSAKDGDDIVEYTAGSPNRFMLRKRRASVARDLQGNAVRGFGGTLVEQCAVAGYGASVVYWKVCKP